MDDDTTDGCDRDSYEGGDNEISLWVAVGLNVLAMVMAMPAALVEPFNNISIAMMCHDASISSATPVSTFHVPLPQTSRLRMGTRCGCLAHVAASQPGN